MFTQGADRNADATNTEPLLQLLPGKLQALFPAFKGIIEFITVDMDIP